MQNILRMVGFSLASSLMICAPHFSQAATDAPDGGVTPVIAGGGDTADSTVTGQVKFEKRFTKVIDTICGSKPCHSSSGYWSMVVQSAGSTYLYNQKLNMGSIRAPEVLTLAGVNLRSGSLVKIDGKIETGGPNYFILSDVKKVTLIMGEGWMCHNLKATDPNLSARVWFDATQGQAGAYKIEVQGDKDHSLYPVANVNNANFTAESNNVGFGGADSTNRYVELTIEQDGVHFMDLPSTLRISNGPSIESAVEMNCSKTQFHGE
jgi:hypothetical protein